MKLQKRTVTLFGLLCLTGALAFGVVNRPIEPSAANDEAARREVQAMLEQMKAQKAVRERRSSVMPYPDDLLGETVLPASPWYDAEKRRYLELLIDFAPDVLLVPVQVQGAGIERANRSLMTESLAAALPRNLRMAPPQLVSRALGEGFRRIDRTAVLDLATAMRAKRVIWSYAGHRNDQQLHLHFEIQEPGADGLFNKADTAKGVSFGVVPMPDESTPIQVFRQQLPKIVETIGYAIAQPTRLAAGTLPERFPASLGDASAASLPPVDRALYLQLLAALTPRDARRTRELLFERSLLMAWQMPPENPATRLLMARAFLGLGMRTAGLAVLDNPRGDAELALTAALNGNLPDLDRLRGKLGRTPLGLMAEIEATDIRFAYERESKESQTVRARWMASLAPPWKQLAERRWIDADPVTLYGVDPGFVVGLFGETFPQSGPRLADRVRGRAIVGKRDPLDAEKALATYLHPRLAVTKVMPCCADAALPGGTPWRLDVFDFLVGAGIADITYRANRMITTQGRYMDGLAYLDAIEASMGQHPEWIKLRSQAENNIAKVAEPAERDAWADRAIAHWDTARPLLSATEHQVTDRPALGPLIDLEGMRGSRVADGWNKTARVVLINATFSTDPLRVILELTASPDEQLRVLESVSGRFQGSSVPHVLRAKHFREQGKLAEMRELLNKAVAEKMPNAEVYRLLAQGYFLEQRLPDAANALSSFPGLRADSPTHPLARDNFAHEAGSYLFWRGAPMLAIPLYRQTAQSQTGSGASILNAARVELLEENYGRALGHYLTAIRRYDHSTAYRDYFGLLHLIGESGAAWDAFRVQAPRIRGTAIWNATLAGHRKEGLNATQIVAWAKLAGFITEGSPDILLTRYLALASLMDRVPDDKALQEIEALGKITQNGDYIVPFARAYMAIRQNDPARAETLLALMYKTRRFGNPDTTYSLPYYALAAARSGKAEAARTVIESVHAMDRGTATLLANAVLDALADKPGAIGGFYAALDSRNDSGIMPLTMEYHFVDLAEQVFQATKDAAYRDFALMLARANQKTQPWEAWSHAYVAVHSDQPAEQRDALRRAVFLDPNSAWLALLPKKDTETALNEVKNKTPFALKEPGGMEYRTAT